MAAPEAPLPRLSRRASVHEPLFAAEHEQVDTVRVVASLDIEETVVQIALGIERQDAHERFVGVVLGEQRLHVLRLGASGELIGREDTW